VYSQNLVTLQQNVAQAENDDSSKTGFLEPLKWPPANGRKNVG